MDEMETAFLQEGESESTSALLGFGEPEGYDNEPFGEPALGESVLGEYEDESDHETESEQFFGGLGNLIKRAAPILKSVAARALPIVATAVGGPIGGAAAKLLTGGLGGGAAGGGALGGILGGLFGGGRRATPTDMSYGVPVNPAALPDVMAGGDFGGGFDFESADMEGDLEAVITAPPSMQQALGGVMASLAANAQGEAEAGAQMGAAVMITLTPDDRRALGQFLPAVLNGAAALTRVLRSYDGTRVALPVVPQIVRATARTLKKRAAAGQPVTKKVAAMTMAKHTSRALQPNVAMIGIRKDRTAKKKLAQQIQQREGFAF